MSLRRSITGALLAPALALALLACEPHTVSVRFDPAVGDRYGFRSRIETTFARTIDGETTADDDASVLDATEEILAIDGDEITAGVTVSRDGGEARSYEVRVDRADRLTAIDLVEGVPADALGLDVATELPADVSSPPDRPLEPGETWVIDRSVPVAGRDRPVTVTGHGRVASLGVVDGHEVAVVVVELRVPVRSLLATGDGRIAIDGVQRTTTRTTYDLSDGATRAERTSITGRADVLVEPPASVDAPPATGEIRYAVTVRTERVPAD